MKNADGKEVTTRPWQLVEWKTIRREKLGDHCLQCGSTKQPLVLHHLCQPPTFRMIKALAVRDLFKAGISSNEIEPPPMIPHYFCPECHSGNVRARETIKPPWICNRCHKEFEAPKEGFLLDPREAKRLLIKFKEFEEENREIIQAECQAISEEHHKRYMSCEDTATFCRKCAFLWDMKGMSLCQKCKAHYKELKFPYCFNCSKELGLVPQTIRGTLRGG